ncbi:MAG: substrate-binding domain-containing protein [Lachnospiraceae bacterium]|nr:substrate-binding domain-containing protein [Lachnospiraceae bacterium]
MVNRRTAGIVSGIILLAALAATICLVAIYARQAHMLSQRGAGTVQEEYRRHYAFVCGTSQEDLYRAIYEAAREKAAESNDYLEFVGDNLTVTYSRNELMEIAVDSGVDGIIVEADESEVMTELIDRADEKGIPVITVGRDNTASGRKSFVGFGFYDLGQTFGKQIIRNASDDPKDVLILMSSDTEGSTQNIIYQGIRETLERLDSTRYFTLNTMTVPESTAFGAEEVISSMFRKSDELPDIIVCLNEVYTTCVCQALVDHNRVGETLVYGFYENSTILSSIQKNIIMATVTVNTDQMGEFCVEALEEYNESGYVNEFFPADIDEITQDNVNEYLTAASGDGQNG